MADHHPGKSPVWPAHLRRFDPQVWEWPNYKDPDFPDWACPARCGFWHRERARVARSIGVSPLPEIRAMNDCDGNHDE